MASEKHEGGKDASKVLKNSLLLVAAGAVGGVLVYSLFPSLLVKIFFGGQYLSAIPYLGLFAVFMGLYAIVDLVSQFFLSVRNFRPAVVLVGFSVLQTIFIFLFHQTLSQVIFVNIGTMVGLLFAFGVSYLLTSRK